MLRWWRFKLARHFRWHHSRLPALRFPSFLLLLFGHFVAGFRHATFASTLGVLVFLGLLLENVFRVDFAHEFGHRSAWLALVIRSFENLDAGW